MSMDDIKRAERFGIMHEYRLAREAVEECARRLVQAEVAAELTGGKGNWFTSWLTRKQLERRRRDLENAKFVMKKLYNRI